MKEPSPLVFTRSFKVKGHDVNKAQYLTIPMLFRYLQECSLDHARSLKASVWDLEEKNVSWVLLRKELKVIDHLKLDEKFTIITYPSGFDKFFAYRDFLVFSEDKKLIVGASSAWTLIDLDERKLTKIPEQILEIGLPTGLKFLKKPETKIQKPKVDSFIDHRKMRGYDMDWNGHVNNMVLIRSMIEPMKESGIEDQDIKRILCHFKNEAQLGDELNVKLQDQNPIFRISLENEKTIALSEVELMSKTEEKSIENVS